MDDSGRANRKENIASSAGGEGACGFLFGHRFPEPDDVGSEEAVTTRTPGRHIVCFRPVRDDDPFVETFCARDIAMQFNHVAAAGAAMEVVHVLRDESEGRDTLLPFDEGYVGWIGFGFCDEFAPPCVPFPDEARFTAEGGWRGEFLRFEFRPKAGLRIAKRRDAALGRNTCTGKNGDALRGAEAVKKLGREGHWGVSASSLKQGSSSLRI